MHAVVKASPGPGAVFEQWPTPKPGLRDILVRIEATSICGTDMHIYDWHESIRDKVKPPMVMGHEFAGKIIEVGKEVSDLREGDIVSGETHIFCGKCFQCRTGNAHICERMLLRGVDTDGCFAEYHVLNEQHAWLTIVRFRSRWRRLKSRWVTLFTLPPRQRSRGIPSQFLAAAQSA